MWKLFQRVPQIKLNVYYNAIQYDIHTPWKLPQRVSQTLWNGSKLWYQVVHSRNCINHTWPGVICIYQGRFDTIRQKLICIYQRPHWALHQPGGGACSWRLRYKEIMVMREPVRRWWLVDHSPLGCILTPITPNFVSFAEKLICYREQQIGTSPGFQTFSK